MSRPRLLFLPPLLLAACVRPDNTPDPQPSQDPYGHDGDCGSFLATGDIAGTSSTTIGDCVVHAEEYGTFVVEYE